MLEVRPQMTFSAEEGMLRVNYEAPHSYLEAGSATLALMEDAQTKALDTIRVLPGFAVKEVDKGATVDVEVEKTLSDHADGIEEGARELLLALDSLLPHHHRLSSLARDDTDRIIIQTARLNNQNWGRETFVYPHFQRWLNGPGLTEDSAREGVMALAVPYGEKEVVRRAFNYKSDSGSQRGRARRFEVTAKRREMETFRFGKKPKPGEESPDKESPDVVDWRVLDVMTGFDGRGFLFNAPPSTHVWLKSPNKSLYEMCGFRVNEPQRSLSVMLLMAAVSLPASQYQGRENIFGPAKRPAEATE
jgi:hypothetical protein